MKESCFLRIASKALVRIQQNLYTTFECKGESRHKNLCMARVLSFLIRYFSNFYTLHRSDLAAQAAPLDPRLEWIWRSNLQNLIFSWQVLHEKMKIKFQVSKYCLRWMQKIWRGQLCPSKKITQLQFSRALEID